MLRNSLCFGGSSPRKRRFLPALLILFTMAMSTVSFAQNKLQAVVNIQQAPVYKSASADSAVLVLLSRGEELTVEEWSDDGFCRIVIGSNKGYIRGTQLKRLTISEKYATAKRGRINADSVNLRTRPDLDSSIVSIVKKNSTLDVLSRSDNWYKVSYGIHIGYVDVEYVDVENTDLSQDLTSLTTLRMGMSGIEVVRMQQALADKNYFKGKISGSFGARTRDAVKAIQEENGLVANGIADQQTLEIIYKI